MMDAKHYQEKIKLLVAGGEIEVPISLTDQKREIGADITVRIEYAGNEYVASGEEPEWTDAFADLQKKLPQDVVIKCCLSCRHGTLCPYGCIPNMVLCAQSQHIESKYDVIEWLEEADIDSIKRSSFQSCDQFEPAGELYYTYNDFLHWMRK